MIDNNTKTPVKSITDPSVQSVEVNIIESTQLLGNDGRVTIQHRGEIYHLRQTRAGKLILTK